VISAPLHSSNTVQYSQEHASPFPVILAHDLRLYIGVYPGCRVSFSTRRDTHDIRPCTGAGAAVTVRTYWAWECTATLRLLSGARGAGAPTGDERGEVYRVATLTIYCKPAGSTSAMHVTFDEIHRT